MVYKKKPNHTLSPFPSGPILLNPSFQSPIPIFGKPFSPKLHALLIALLQCLYIVSSCLPDKYLSYLYFSFSSRIFPSKYGVLILKI